jgi:hypothetical protein
MFHKFHIRYNVVFMVGEKRREAGQQVEVRGDAKKPDHHMFVTLKLTLPVAFLAKKSPLRVRMRTTHDKKVLLDNAKYLRDNTSVVDLDPHGSIILVTLICMRIRTKYKSGSASNKNQDPDPHQSDKLDLEPDPDPHQFADDKPKCMEYELM